MSNSKSEDTPMTELEKVNGCMALLVELCMRKTNATKATFTTEGLSYKGKVLGDYKLVIEKVSSPSEPPQDTITTNIPKIVEILKASEPQDTSLDDTNKALERAFIDYRIKCDMALSERDDGVYTQAEYEEAIMWNLDNAISFVHEIYSSRIVKLLQVIEDEVIGDDILMDNGTPVNHTLHNFRTKQRQALKKLKDNVINGGSL